MANFQDIKGFNIQSKSSDPVPYAQALINNPYGGSWSTKSNMQSSTGGVSGSGTTSATIAAGGYPANDRAETWDGSSWTEVNEINTARGNAGATGTGSTASVLFGGRTAPGALSALNESWNGSTWTEVGDLNTASRQMAYFGTQTAAIKADGIPYPTNSVETWNGTSWSEAQENNTARQSLAGSTGSPSSNGIIFAGYTTTYVANVETWNGSSWTETTEINTARGELGGAGSSSTNAIGYAGETGPGAMSQTESWDGSSWTEVNEVNTARYQVGYSGSSNASALLFGGLTPSATNATEEWAFSGLPPSTPAADYSDSIVGDMYYNTSSGQFKAIKTGGAPIGTWASGGTLNTARNVMFSASAAPQSAAMIFGGYVSSPSAASKANTEKYDGTSWTEDSDLNTARRLGVGTGSQPAALASTGQVSPGPGLVANVESWNGSGWSETTDVNTARRNLAAFGIQTASLITGGLTPSITAITESWNGTSWTEKGDLNTARESFAGFGNSYTSGLVAGGYVSSPTPNSAITETWNGTSWTEVADLNTGRKQHAATGQDVDSGMIVAGYTTTGLANAESWDGTSWTEQADLATARWELGGMGTTLAGLVCGGDTPGGKSNLTEEFTANDFQIKTVTTS